MLRRLRRIAVVERGFTLVEQLVVIAIIGIMSAVTVSLVTLIFDSNIRSGQMLDQQTTIESSYGFLAARLSLAQKPIGLLNDPANTKIDPLTIAGDQLVFKLGGSEGNCVRVFYEEDQSRVRAKLSDDCVKIRPKRGPNETVAGHEDGQFDVGDPQYDSILDEAPGQGPAGQETGAFVLADGVTKDRPSTAPDGYPDPLQLFTYRDESNNVISDIAPQASTKESDYCGDTNPATPCWYDTTSNRKDISSADVTMYVDAVVGSGGPRVRPRVYRQQFSFQQVCAAPAVTGSGVTPGTIADEGRVDGQVGAGTRTIAASATEDVYRASSGTLKMASPDITTLRGWVRFDGQLVTRRSAIGNFTVRVTLYRNGTATADDAGRTTFQYPVFVPTATAANQIKVPISGSFKVATNAEAPATKYSVGVSIVNTAGGTVTYETGSDSLWLQYSMVAR